MVAPMSQNCMPSKATKDGGYSWVVMVTSCLSHFSHIGFSLGVAGNLTIAHQEFFNVDLQQGSLIGTIHIGLVYMLAPIPSVMVRKLGCRVTELIGGACVITGVGLSAFSTELWHAILLYSILAGAGVSCCYIATSQILAVYFDKYKYLAFSLAMLGNYVGTVVWPVLSQHLLNKFGYSHAMAIMASAHVLHIIAGITFIEPKASDLSETFIDQEKSEMETVANGEDIEGCDNPSFTKNEMEEKLEDLKQEKSEEIKKGESEIVEVTRNLRNEFIGLLKSVQIWLVMATSLLRTTNTAGFLILLNSYIIHNTDMDKDTAALGVTILGVANIVGSGTVALTSSLKFNRMMLHFAAIILSGVTAVAASYTNTKEMYYSLAACWGLGASVTLSTILGLASDLCKPRQLPLVFGLHLFAAGVGSLGLVPLAGFCINTNSDESVLLFTYTAWYFVRKEIQ